MPRSVLIALLGLAAALILPTSAAPAPAPPTARIAFASDRDWGTIPSTQIYSVNANGTGLTKLTNYPWWALTPTWSPDGTRITFTGIRPEAAFKDGNQAYHAHAIFHAHDIYVMNADGSHITKVTSGKSLHVLPSWSPRRDRDRVRPEALAAHGCAYRGDEPRRLWGHRDHERAEL